MYKTMKQLPEDERPYEKCKKMGVNSLTDKELVAILLRSGTKECNSLQLSEQLFSIHPVYKGLNGLPYLNYEQLVKIKGIGQVKALQILCLVELSKRLSAARTKERLKLMTPPAIANYYMDSMRYLTKEQLMVLLLDSKNCLMKETVLSVGTINASLISPREVFLEALRCDAVGIVLLHNHPSGDPTPSNQDLIVTQKILQAGKLMGIPLLDHIIVGEHRYTSFFEQGLLQE